MEGGSERENMKGGEVVLEMITVGVPRALSRHILSILRSKTPMIKIIRSKLME